jgi:hypothetical protein
MSGFPGFQHFLLEVYVAAVMSADVEVSRSASGPCTPNGGRTVSASRATDINYNPIDYEIEEAGPRRSR